MLALQKDEQLAVSIVEAIQTGNLEALKRLLSEHASLSSARIEGEKGTAGSRTLLHIATDWPGHFPNDAETIAALVQAGADPNTPCAGRHSETPLHWAASSDDIEALDALLDVGADIEAPGAVVGGGTALDNAVAFGQWQAARRLVERGARAGLWHVAALGMMSRVEDYFGGDVTPAPADVTESFWQACHGGQRQVAEYLLDHGAELNWIGYDERTALDIAKGSGADDIVEWLQDRGARLACELG
jgi:ankyrin repeat protein